MTRQERAIKRPQADHMEQNKLRHDGQAKTGGKQLLIVSKIVCRPNLSTLFASYAGDVASVSQSV